MIAIKFGEFEINSKKLTYSIAETARLTGCDKDVINTAIKNGELQFIIPEGRIQKRVSIFDLITFLNNRSMRFD